MFVHYSAVQMDGYRNLEDGPRVRFEVGPGKKGEEAKKGKEATNVRVV